MHSRVRLHNEIVEDRKDEYAQERQMTDYRVKAKDRAVRSCQLISKLQQQHTRCPQKFYNISN